MVLSVTFWLQMVAETAPLSGSFNVQPGNDTHVVRAPLPVFHAGCVLQTFVHSNVSTSCNGSLYYCTSTLLTCFAVQRVLDLIVMPTAEFTYPIGHAFRKEVHLPLQLGFACNEACIVAIKGHMTSMTERSFSVLLHAAQLHAAQLHAAQT